MTSIYISNMLSIKARTKNINVLNNFLAEYSNLYMVMVQVLCNVRE